MLNVTTRGEQVYYYDPVSSRGSRRFAFRAVRLDNPSEHTLESGPFTVYAEGQFLGEGLSEPIPPKSAAFIPFALDKQLVVEPVVDTREEIERLVTIQRGIVRTDAQTVRRTKLALANRGDAPAKVWVRHAVPEGWKLRDSKVKVEKLRGAHLFPITVPARGALELVIEESQPLEKTIDINTDAGVETLALFLNKQKPVQPELAKQLDEIVRLYKEMGRHPRARRDARVADDHLSRARGRDPRAAGHAQASERRGQAEPPSGEEDGRDQRAAAESDDRGQRPEGQADDRQGGPGRPPGRAHARDQAPHRGGRQALNPLKYPASGRSHARRCGRWVFVYDAGRVVHWQTLPQKTKSASPSSDSAAFWPGAGRSRS
jgi:hypothetical protein